jgi:hypothetical protein
MLKRYSIVPLGALALALTSCATQYTNVRTTWTIDRYQEVVVSNSTSFKLQPTRSQGHIKINYSFLVENISNAASYSFDLTQASIILNKQTTSLPCETAKDLESKLTLEPGKRAIIQCAVTLAPNVENALDKQDTSAELKIPMTGPEGQSWIAFNYTLRTTDFK